MWGAECDEEMHAAEAAISNQTLTSHDMCHFPNQVSVDPFWRGM